MKLKLLTNPGFKRPSPSNLSNGDKSPEKPKPKIEVVANGDKSPEQVKPDEIEIIDEARP